MAHRISRYCTAVEYVRTTSDARLCRGWERVIAYRLVTSGSLIACFTSTSFEVLDASTRPKNDQPRAKDRKSGSCWTPAMVNVSSAFVTRHTPEWVMAPRVTRPQSTGKSHGPLLSAGPFSNPVWVTVTLYLRSHTVSVRCRISCANDAEQ